MYFPAWGCQATGGLYGKFSGNPTGGSRDHGFVDSVLIVFFGSLLFCIAALRF